MQPQPRLLCVIIVKCVFLVWDSARGPFVVVALENKAKRRSGSWRSNFCPSRAIESSIIYLVKYSKDVVSSSGL